MPRIDNAQHLRLSDIVHQLATYSAHDAREVRSKRDDLYVKEQKAPFTAPGSRTNHRTKAIALIRGNLAEEFGTTNEEARQILSRVFGHAPTRITVNDIILLCDLGNIARPLIAGGESAVEAFDSAIREYERPDSKRCQDTGIPLTGSQKPPEAKTVSGEKSVEASEDKAEYSDKSVEAPISREEAGDVIATACRLMADFRPYESCLPEQIEAWLFFAQKLGAPNLFPTDLLQSLPIDQRISMQMALAEHLQPLRQHDDTIPEQTSIARTIIWLDKTYAIADLITPDDEKTLDTVLSEAGENQILRNAYANWKEMNTTQRMEAIQTLIDLHAEKFGYADHKAKLTFEFNDDPNIWGGTHIGGITINASNKGFGDFRQVVNTTIHESTHWYQRELISRAYDGKIDADSPIYHQATLLYAANQAGIDFDYLTQTLGFSRDEAYAAYKNTPDEHQAFQSGDYAGAQVDKIFAPNE